MPKRVAITEEEISWLRRVHKETSYTAMAEQVGVCVDTLKRILAREGIEEFDAAKYVVAPKLSLQTWERPCIGCRSKERRPKWQYFCDRCQRSHGLASPE